MTPLRGSGHAKGRRRRDLLDPLELEVRLAAGDASLAQRAPLLLDLEGYGRVALHSLIRMVTPDDCGYAAISTMNATMQNVIKSMKNQSTESKSRT